MLFQVHRIIALLISFRIIMTKLISPNWSLKLILQSNVFLILVGIPFIIVLIFFKNKVYFRVFPLSYSTVQTFSRVNIHGLGFLIDHSRVDSLDSLIIWVLCVQSFIAIIVSILSNYLMFALPTASYWLVRLAVNILRWGLIKKLRIVPVSDFSNFMFEDL